MVKIGMAHEIEHPTYLNILKSICANRAGRKVASFLDA